MSPPLKWGLLVSKEKGTRSTASQVQASHRKWCGAFWVNDITMEQVTRDDIQREGLHQSQPLASARSEAAQRAKDYEAHLKRMELDQEYRMRWEQNEREMEESKQRGYEHL